MSLGLLNLVWHFLTLSFTQSKSSGLGKKIVLIGLITLLSACSTLERRPAVPKLQNQSAEVIGMPGVRYLITSQNGLDAMANDLANEQKIITQNGKRINNTQLYYLSISGGGDNGAFGAGLLTGWTKKGDRPQFHLVTGVSTGALIAPFAYLGKDYDHVLRKVYTETSPSDIYLKRGLFSAIFEDGLVDTTPLYDLISKYIDEEFLKKIAYEYNHRHRWLLIGTTNIDAGAPVIWNMGKIASYGTPEAVALFRKILLASASIPGAFPPIMIDVESNGKVFHEMHVDGGATAQVFLYPNALSDRASLVGFKMGKRPKAYIIRNAKMNGEWLQTQRITIDIVARAITHLIQYQGQGDLYRIYETSRKDNVEFNLAYIGADFEIPHKEEFDTDYMKSLFQYAYEQAIEGYQWDKQPPGYSQAMEQDILKHTQNEKTKNTRDRYRRLVENP